ncbi:MAG: HAD family hydrolase [Candidatus Thorarchaeota archaeon]
MVHAIILDMDGVIRHLDMNVAENASQSIGFNFEELMDVLWDNQPGYQLLCGRSFRNIWWKQVQQLDARLNTVTQDFFWNEVLAKNTIDLDVIQFINEIRQNLVTGILTNCDRESKNEIKRTLGKSHPFDHILSSSDLGAKKPEPEIYRRLLETIGVGAEDCIFFDDRISNVEGARAVGIQAHLFQGLDQMKRLFFSI